MKKRTIKLFTFILVSFALASCFNEKTDNELIQKDLAELSAQLDNHKVLFYKYGKLIVRSNVIGEEQNSNDVFGKELPYFYEKLLQHEADSLSLSDYIAVFKTYNTVKEKVKNSNEDDYPTLTEAFLPAFVDSLDTSFFPKGKKEKAVLQSMEHGFLSGMVLASKNLGADIALYECSMTKTDILPQSEIRALLQLHKSLIFMAKDLLYISEIEQNNTIEWLNSKPEDSFEITQLIFSGYATNRDSAQLYFHALSHLVRGLDRIKMPRESDNEKGITDLEIFLNDAKQIGLEEDIVYGIEAYVAIKREDSERAIVALKHLKKSKHISRKDKANIKEAIGYLKNREPDKVLNGVYDKIFISKLAFNYVVDYLAQVQWERVLEQRGIHVNDHFTKAIEEINKLSEKAEKYSNTETYINKGKEVTNEIKDKAEEEGKKLWGKAKGLIGD